MRNEQAVNDISKYNPEKKKKRQENHSNQLTAYEGYFKA